MSGVISQLIADGLGKKLPEKMSRLEHFNALFYNLKAMSEINKTSEYNIQNLERQQKERVTEIKEKHREEIEALQAFLTKQKDDLENAYKLDLSRDRDNFETSFAEVRDSNKKRLENEKIGGEIELEKVRKSYQDKIAKYRESQEKILTDMKRNYDNSSKDMQRRIEKVS